MKTSTPRDTSMLATAHRSIVAMTSAEPLVDRCRFPTFTMPRERRISSSRKKRASRKILMPIGRRFRLPRNSTEISAMYARRQRILDMASLLVEHSIPTARQRVVRAQSLFPIISSISNLALYKAVREQYCSTRMLWPCWATASSRYQTLPADATPREPPVSTVRSRFRLTGARNSSASTM